MEIDDIPSCFRAPIESVNLAGKVFRGLRKVDFYEY